MLTNEAIDRAHWSFETENFLITFRTEDEIDNPRDVCCEEDIEFAMDGGAHWFAAIVEVFAKKDNVEVFAKKDNDEVVMIGQDYLGGCSYNSFREFYTSHRDRDPMNRNCSLMRAAKGDNVVICHYFPGMIASAIEDARSFLNRVKYM